MFTYEIDYSFLSSGHLRSSVVASEPPLGLGLGIRWGPRLSFRISDLGSQKPKLGWKPLLANDLEWLVLVMIASNGFVLP